MAKQWAIILTRGFSPLFWVWVLLVACQAENAPLATLPPPPTISLRTPDQHPTLPPTWTVAPSLTPSPILSPTPTRTFTPSPSPTETLTTEALCDQFKLTGSPRYGVSLDYDAIIGLQWENAPPDSTVVILFSYPDSGDEDQFAQFDPANGFHTQFDLMSLSGWGKINWELSLFLGSYEGLCAVSGQFYREPWWLKPIANPLNPPFSR